MDFFGKFGPIVSESDTIDRKKLYITFNEAFKRGHIFVSAPTGYGKTLSIYLWIKSEGFDCSWINLDKLDNSLASFREATKKTALNGDFDAVPLGKASKVLVLDDFQFIDDKDLLNYLSMLLKRSYASSRMVLISRTKPPEAFVELTLNGELQIIGLQNLMFDKYETDFFLSKRGLRYPTLPYEWQLKSLMVGQRQ